MNDDDWWWKMNMTNELDDVDVMRIYDWLMLLWRLHANKLLHFSQGIFTHKKNTERSRYTEEFLHRNFYTEISVQGKRLYTDRMTHTHRNFWKHLHKKHFLQENFYIQKLLHRKKKCTEQLLHTDGRDLVAPAALREIWKDTSRPPRN
jgi:hypothetical protein